MLKPMISLELEVNGSTSNNVNFLISLANIENVIQFESVSMNGVLCDIAGASLHEKKNNVLNLEQSGFIVKCQ